MHRARFAGFAGAGALAASGTRAALSCPNGWQETNGECFRLFSAATDWAGDWDHAQATCVAHGARLAQIASDGENRGAARLLGAADAESAWIGLRLKTSDAVSAWTDGSELGAFTSWDTGEPDLIEPENCVKIFPYGGWEDTSCAETNAFLCSMSANPSAASGGRMLGCQGGHWQITLCLCLRALYSLIIWSFVWRVV
jgi:hypothetical protein